MAKSRKAACYTYAGGREIHRGGVPFISIGREGGTKPVEADAVTRTIVKMLNRRGGSCGSSEAPYSVLMKRWGQKP